MPKLCVWGNSLGVRLPSHIAEITGVKAGDELNVRVADSGVIEITPARPLNMPAIRDVPVKTRGKNKLEDW